MSTVFDRLSTIATSREPNAARVGDCDGLSVGDVREVMRLLADREGWIRAANKRMAAVMVLERLRDDDSGHMYWGGDPEHCEKMTGRQACARCSATHLLGPVSSTGEPTP